MRKKSQMDTDEHGLERGKGQFLVYQAEDGKLKLDVRLEDESVWLNQQLMADLFQTTKQNISLHIQNIYEEGELVPEATVKKYLTVRQEGNNEFPDIDCSIPSGAFDTHDSEEIGCQNSIITDGQFWVVISKYRKAVVHFLYAFAKGDKANISAKEEAALSLVAEAFVSTTERQVQELLAVGSIWEVKRHE